MAGFISPRVADLEKKLKKDPSSLIFVQLAEEYRRGGAYDDALRICRDGLARHPHHVSANMVLGRVYFETRRYKESRGELEKVIAASPENLMAHRLLGDLHWMEENWEQAEKRYRMVNLLNPSDVDCTERLRIVDSRLKERRRAEAASAGEPRTIGMVPSGEHVPEPGVDVPLIDIQSFEEEVAHAPVTTWEQESAALAPGIEEIEQAELTPEEPERAAVDLQLEPAGAQPEPLAVEVAVPEEPTSGFYALSSDAAAAGVESTVDHTESFPEVAIEAVTEEAPAPQADEGDFPHAASSPAPPEPEMEIATPTLAELYALQGYFDRAISVYRTLLGRDPGNPEFEHRISELSARLEPLTEAAPIAPLELTVEEKVAILQRWLLAVRRNRMPLAG